jgi:Zn-dependent peptidase ImmA (M78 family)
MEKALAQIGGSVRHATRDQIEIRGARDFTVWVDPNCSEFSRRHRLACLLGHYVLHGQAGRLSRQHPPRMWDEANDFAMGFLIAERTLRALLKRAATLGEMVNRFKVPPVLIAMRIKSLSQDSRVEAGETVPKKRR